ncbi:MAG: single-stranded DNA-binding protein [Aggregatilineales bacterium]
MTYQQITIVGNVGRDPEIKYLPDGTAVTDFSVAVSEVTGRGEQRKEKTLWFKVTIWRERAELAAQLIKKGIKVLVVGKVDVYAYTDKTSGEARASLQITANNFQLLTPKGEAQPEGGSYAGNSGGKRAQGGGGEQPYTEADDIPF